MISSKSVLATIHAQILLGLLKINKKTVSSIVQRETMIKPANHQGYIYIYIRETSKQSMTRKSNFVANIH